MNELQIVKENEILSISNFDKLKENVVGVCDLATQNECTSIVEYETLKSQLTLLNKLDKTYSNAKSEVVNQVMGGVVAQIDSLREIIKDAQLDAKAKIKYFENENGIAGKEKMAYLTFKCKDIKTLQEVKKFIEDNFNLKGEIKQND